MVGILNKRLTRIESTIRISAKFIEFENIQNKPTLAGIFEISNVMTQIKVTVRYVLNEPFLILEIELGIVLIDEYLRLPKAKTA